MSERIEVPSGVAKFYRDYAKFVGVPFEEIIQSELFRVVKSLLDELSGLPNFSVEDATKRYDLLNRSATLVTSVLLTEMQQKT